MSTLLQDVRYGVRMLAKNPGFTAVAVLTLALGIGANTALFSVFNGVLLNPLPYSQPERLIALYSRTPDEPRWSISYPNFTDWVKDNHSFEALAAYREDGFSLTGLGRPERVSAEMISASFFPLLGVRTVIGRPFLPEEDQAGAAPVVLISEGFWKRKFGSAPDAVGKTLTLTGTPYTIVGVIPAGFHFDCNNFGVSNDVFVPIGQWNDLTFRDRRIGMGMDAVGRLKPGVTYEQAKADMDALAKHLAEEYPDADKGMGITLVPLKQNMVGHIKPFLVVLLASVGFVLLIACTNVANLMLARASGRAHEFAIRTTLGANRWRVVRQLLTESILLGSAGGGLGLLLASWGMQGILRVLPEELPRVEEIRLDGRVLLFTLASSVLASILFGLAPALSASRGDLHGTLREAGRGLSGVRHRAQGVLVAVEVALALVLLIGAGLTMRSLARLWNVDVGFNPRNVLSFSASLPLEATSKPDVARSTWRLIRDRLAAVPGIRSASISVGAMPMAGDSELAFWREGQPRPTSQADMKQAILYIVQPDYLKVMEIPLHRGRFLSSLDNEHSRLVAVIDEQFARLYFAGEDPVGKQIHLDLLKTPAEIVGVVGHVKQWGLGTDLTSSLQAQCYMEITQLPDQVVPMLAGYTILVVRTEGSPLAQMGSIRRTFEQFDSQQVVYNVRTMDGMISNSLADRRFSLVLLSTFAALALLMSSVGIFGVVSYLAGQRTREIGIRLALGAERGQVLRMVLRDGATMAALGVGIGIVAALGLTRFMASLPFGVSAHDPATYAAVAAFLLLVALGACYVPARKATRVEPLVALRYE